jgi:16S rRNA (uracil1498-N3)-methyltransferase
VLLLEPSAADAGDRLRHLPSLDRLTLFVGPEGGWTAREVQHARERQAMLLTLGAQTLRADAVPIVAITAVRVRLEDF